MCLLAECRVNDTGCCRRQLGRLMEGGGLMKGDGGCKERTDPPSNRPKDKELKGKDAMTFHAQRSPHSWKLCERGQQGRGGGRGAIPPSIGLFPSLSPPHLSQVPCLAESPSKVCLLKNCAAKLVSIYILRAPAARTTTHRKL